MLATDAQTRHLTRQFMESKGQNNSLFAGHFPVAGELEFQTGVRCHRSFSLGADSSISSFDDSVAAGNLTGRLARLQNPINSGGQIVNDDGLGDFIR
jgi:hypothetical protein